MNMEVFNTSRITGNKPTQPWELSDELDYSDLNWTLSWDFFPQDGERSTEEIALKCVFYIIAICFALFGNLAVIIVIIRTKGLRTRFNMYIVNLAIADFFMPAFSMWLHLGRSISTEWIFGKALCQMHTFVQVTFVCASVFTMSVLTLDRYLSTIQSQHVWITQKFQIAIIAFIWIASLGIGTPWIIYTVYREFDWLGRHEVICQAMFPSINARKAYYITFFVLCYMIPLLLMFAFLIDMIIKSNRKTSNVARDGYAFQEIQKKAAYLLLTILVVFCICWTPQQTLLVWDVFRDRNKKPNGVEEFHYITLFLAYSTSIFNPVVYFIFNKYFRHAFHHLCMTNCKGNVTQATIAPDMEDDEEMGRRTIQPNTVRPEMNLEHPCGQNPPTTCSV